MLHKLTTQTNTNALNDSNSSYSEGTPIVNKIDQNFDIFSQLKLNEMLSSPQIDKRQSNRENLTLQSRNSRQIEKKPTIPIASEETVILPNSKKPIRIFTIYEKDYKGESQMQKEINRLKSTVFERKNQSNENPQPVPHPSMPKMKRQLSGDVVNYKSLMQVLDDEYRQQQQKDKIPTIMIAQGLTPSGDGSRKSQYGSFNRKVKKENNPLAQKFIIMRQQRRKKKQVKQQRRKSCCCHECGGADTTYQMKYNDMDIDTVMARKIRLANIVLENLKPNTSDIKSILLKKEKQMNALKAALEKTLMEQIDKSGQPAEIKADQQLTKQDSIIEEQNLTTIQINGKPQIMRDQTPDRNTPMSKMTDQDYKERLTQTDFEHYKFNRNKSNYSRGTENIKKMRKTIIQFNMIESLTNIHDDNTVNNNNLSNNNNNKSLRQISKSGNLSYRNLNTTDRQTPEKKSAPYKLLERAKGSNQFKQLPPKIVLRQDLQCIVNKKAHRLEKLLEDYETKQFLEESQNNQNTDRSNISIQNSHQFIVPNSCIDLSSSTQTFFSSVFQQRLDAQNNKSLTNIKPLSSVSCSNINKYAGLFAPIKQKQIQGNYYLGTQKNPNEISNQFNNSKNMNGTQSSLNNISYQGKIGSQSSRTQINNKLPQIFNTTTRK